MQNIEAETVEYDVMPDPDIFISAAADIVEPHDDGELSAFAARLCGLGGLSCDEIMESLKQLHVPGDFPHLQVSSLKRGGTMIRQLITPSQQQLTLHEVLISLLTAVRNEAAFYDGEVVWDTTVAMPVKRPGLLDLGIGLRPRLPSDTTEFQAFWDEEFNCMVYGDGDREALYRKLDDGLPTVRDGETH